VAKSDRYIWYGLAVAVTLVGVNQAIQLAVNILALCGWGAGP
jgi:hypothetical protein